MDQSDLPENQYWYTQSLSKYSTNFAQISCRDRRTQFYPCQVAWEKRDVHRRNYTFHRNFSCCRYDRKLMMLCYTKDKMLKNFMFVGVFSDGATGYLFGCVLFASFVFAQLKIAWQLLLRIGIIVVSCHLQTSEKVEHTVAFRSKSEIARARFWILVMFDSFDIFMDLNNAKALVVFCSYLCNINFGEKEKPRCYCSAAVVILAACFMSFWEDGCSLLLVDRHAFCFPFAHFVAKWQKQKNEDETKQGPNSQFWRSQNPTRAVWNEWYRVISTAKNACFRASQNSAERLRPPCQWQATSVDANLQTSCDVVFAVVAIMEGRSCCPCFYAGMMLKTKWFCVFQKLSCIPLQFVSCSKCSLVVVVVEEKISVHKWLPGLPRKLLVGYLNAKEVLNLVCEPVWKMKFLYWTVFDRWRLTWSNNFSASNIPLSKSSADSNTLSTSIHLLWNFNYDSKISMSSAAINSSDKYTEQLRLHPTHSLLPIWAPHLPRATNPSTVGSTRVLQRAEHRPRGKLRK